MSAICCNCYTVINNGVTTYVGCSPCNNLPTIEVNCCNQGDDICYCATISGTVESPILTETFEYSTDGGVIWLPYVESTPVCSSVTFRLTQVYDDGCPDVVVTAEPTEDCCPENKPLLLVTCCDPVNTCFCATVDNSGVSSLFTNTLTYSEDNLTYLPYVEGDPVCPTGPELYFRLEQEYTNGCPTSIRDIHISNIVDCDSYTVQGPPYNISASGICNNINQIELIINVLGGTPPHTYYVNSLSGPTIEVGDILNAGDSYTIIAVDNNGLVATAPTFTAPIDCPPEDNCSPNININYICLESGQALVSFDYIPAELASSIVIEANTSINVYDINENVLSPVDIDGPIAYYEFTDNPASFIIDPGTYAYSIVLTGEGCPNFIRDQFTITCTCPPEGNIPSVGEVTINQIDGD